MGRKHLTLESALKISTYVLKFWNADGDVFFIPYPQFGTFGGLRMYDGYFYQVVADKDSQGGRVGEVKFWNGRYSESVQS